MPTEVLRGQDIFPDITNSPTDMMHAYQSELYSLKPSFTVNVPVPNDKILLVTILLAEVDPAS
jgi:hypothetical protein